MAWIQLSLGADSDAEAERLEDMLLDLGAQAVTLTDAADEPLLEPAPGAIPLWSRTRVTGLFAESASTTAITAAIARRLGRPDAPELQVSLLEDQDWVRAWMDHYHPMRFGHRLWICPSGQQVEAGGDSVVVHLDPGLAFGTGTHPSTALCLAWLDGLDLAGHTAIDYGCGSGILAVAAARLGAAQVWAVDIDPQAETATRANSERNGVAQRVHAGPPSLVHGRRADVVVANILAGPLIALAPHLHALLGDGGRLALAGILDRQADEVMEAYRPFINLETPVFQEGWVRLAGTRR